MPARMITQESGRSFLALTVDHRSSDTIQTYREDPFGKTSLSYFVSGCIDIGIRWQIGSTGSRGQAAGILRAAQVPHAVGAADEAYRELCFGRADSGAESDGDVSCWRVQSKHRAGDADTLRAYSQHLGGGAGDC